MTDFSEDEAEQPAVTACVVWLHGVGESGKTWHERFKQGVSKIRMPWVEFSFPDAAEGALAVLAAEQKRRAAGSRARVLRLRRPVHEQLDTGRVAEVAGQVQQRGLGVRSGQRRTRSGNEPGLQLASKCLDAAFANTLLQRPHARSC